MEKICLYVQWEVVASSIGAATENARSPSEYVAQ